LKEAVVNRDAERTMREEMEIALGERVSEDEAREALERPSPTLGHWVKEQKLAVAVSGSAAIVVGAIISLATGSWLVLVLALLVHGLMTLVVGVMVLKIAGETEKPSPETVARLQAEGVDDPEAKLNRAIQAHVSRGNRVEDTFGITHPNGKH
jgi:hypothetical protein